MNDKIKTTNNTSKIQPRPNKALDKRTKLASALKDNMMRRKAAKAKSQSE